MKELLDNTLVYHSLIAGAIVIAFVLLARLVRAVLAYAGRRIFAKTENILDDRLLEVLLDNVFPVMVLVGLHIAVREVHKGANTSDQTLLQILEYVQDLLYLAAVLVGIRILLGWIREFINWYLDRVSDEGAPRLKMTIGPLTTKIVDMIVGLVAVIVILDHFGVNIGSLLVSLGVGSLAVALAAQDTLANMIAGFVILVDRPFRVGDRIELPSGQVGDVKEIGLRSTRVLNFDHNLMIIPNAELVKGRITNYSHPIQEIRVILRFDLAYGTNPDDARKILIDLAMAQPAVLREPVPAVFVTDVSQANLQMTLVARCNSFNEQYAVETAIREKAYAAFRDRGIAMALPHRIVHTKGPA